MFLRTLEPKDAPLMLEWMFDESISSLLRIGPAQKTLESALEFIRRARGGENSLHYAVADESGEYLGTVSLKNISKADQSAEYAIVIRKKAVGTGAARFAARAILSVAFEELRLNRVYLCAASENLRAIRFHEKTGFRFEGEFKEHALIGGRLRDISWYAMLRREYLALKRQWDAQDVQYAHDTQDVQGAQDTQDAQGAHGAPNLYRI